MQVLYAPEAVAQLPQLKAGEVIFVNYKEKGGLFRNRVVFNRYAISFILNGQKEIYRGSENTLIPSGQVLLIPQGNSLISERSLNQDSYNSLIVFFPGHLVQDFLARHHIFPAPDSDPVPSFLCFQRTSYLSEYVKGILSLIDSGQSLSPAVGLHKLQELLLVFHEFFPAGLTRLFSPNQNNGHLSLKTLIENNLFKNLSLDELAFLANRSLSSFKRDFEKAYGVSPQKYIRDRKLEAAGVELTGGRQPSELYLTYGYDNLSNFSTAFKKKFGVTPAVYRQTHLP